MDGRQLVPFPLHYLDTELIFFESHLKKCGQYPPGCVALGLNARLIGAWDLCMESIPVGWYCHCCQLHELKAQEKWDSAFIWVHKP